VQAALRVHKLQQWVSSSCRATLPISGQICVSNGQETEQNLESCRPHLLNEARPEAGLWPQSSSAGLLAEC